MSSPFPHAETRGNLSKVSKLLKWLHTCLRLHVCAYSIHLLPLDVPTQSSWRYSIHLLPLNVPTPTQFTYSHSIYLLDLPPQFTYSHSIYLLNSPTPTQFTYSHAMYLLPLHVPTPTEFTYSHSMYLLHSPTQSTTQDVSTPHLQHSMTNSACDPEYYTNFHVSIPSGGQGETLKSQPTAQCTTQNGPTFVYNTAWLAQLATQITTHITTHICMSPYPAEARGEFVETLACY